MLNQPHLQMQSIQYPFGFIKLPQPNILSINNKIQIKKLIKSKSDSQNQQNKQKLQILSCLSHLNIINLNNFQQSKTERYTFNLYYEYINYHLKDFVNEIQNEISILHKQLIQMIIYLAKNSIITSFCNKNCGVEVKQYGDRNKKIIKYFLPLKQITISSDINIIKRSVHLFTVQSLQYLDQLVNKNQNQQLKTSQDHYNPQHHSSYYLKQCHFRTSFQHKPRPNTFFSFHSFKPSSIDNLSLHNISLEDEIKRSLSKSIEKSLEFRKNVYKQIQIMKIKSQNIIKKFKDIQKEIIQKKLYKEINNSKNKNNHHSNIKITIKSQCS